MEPFSVTCSSCNGKLIVKNEKLAGQIVPCPRCQAAVAVPTQKKFLFTPPEGAAADSIAITKSVDDDWGKDLEEALAAHRDATTLDRSVSHSQTIESIETNDRLLADRRPPNDNSHEEEEFRLQPLATGNPIAPPIADMASSISESSGSLSAGPNRKKKTEIKKPPTQQPMFIALLGLSGLVLAGVIFYFFMVFAKKAINSNRAQADNRVIQGTKDNEGNIPPVPPNDVANPTNEVKADTQDPSSSNPEAGGGIQATPNTANANGSEKGNVDPPNATANADAPNLASKTTAADSNGGTATPVEPTKSGIGGINPAANNNGNATLPPLFPGSGKLDIVGNPNGAPTAEDADKTSEIFSKMLGMNSRFAVDLSDVSSNDGPKDPKSNPDEFEVKVPIHLVPAPKANPIEALSMPIAKMRLEKKSLVQLANALSSMTRVGISLDLESIAAVGLSASTPLEIDVRDTNVGEMLQGVLTPLGLRVSTYRELVRLHRGEGIDPASFADLDQGLLFIHATDESIAAKLPKSWSIEGLVPAEKVEEFAKALVKLLPEESVHWKLVGTEIVWQPTVKPIIQSRLSVVLDRVRVALGKPSLSGYHPTGLLPGLDLAPVLSKIQKTLPNENTQRRPLAQILFSSASQRESTLLIDWSSVWRHGLTPATEEHCLVRNRDLTEIVREFEEKYALELTAIDHETLWLTTPETRRLASQIRVMPLREGEGIDKLRESLRIISPTDFQRKSRLVVVEVPGRPFALVRVCPPTIHQLAALAVP